MLNIAKLIKPWKEAASLNAQVSLYGFWDMTTFLTKGGDLGMVLGVAGIDYESLDGDEQAYAVKRLESAMKCFGEGFHVYQYLFKQNRPHVPFAKYEDALIDAAVEQRRKFFEERRDNLYEIEIVFVVLIEGSQTNSGLLSRIWEFLQHPKIGYPQLKALFASNQMTRLLHSQVEADRIKLEQRVKQFMLQMHDLVSIRVFNQEEQFAFFRRLLNFEAWRIHGRPTSTQYLDCQVANSDIEAERDHLKVGNHFIRILTMKESMAETRPLVLDSLIKLQANFYVVSEWTPLSIAKARREVEKRRKHFNMTKSDFLSQVRDSSRTREKDVLIDESKQADVDNLGECLRLLGEGQGLGEFSLTIILYGKDLKTLEHEVAAFAGVFTNLDGTLYPETYNQLNAFFSTIPGNHAQNLRKQLLLGSNYADLSFLFTIDSGETTNSHLVSEYLAVMETAHATPYYLNLHSGEVAHTLILGMTGSGKTTLLNALADFIPNQERIVVIEDTSELRIGKANVLAAECQTEAHAGAVHFNDLLRAALRWRPDRIILGEVRGDEARTLLDSFNTGHAGSMATIHASSPVKALRRFAELAMRTHQQSSFDEVATEISESVDSVLQVCRSPDGRKVSEIIDVRGYDRVNKMFLYDVVFQMNKSG